MKYIEFFTFYFSGQLNLFPISISDRRKFIQAEVACFNDCIILNAFSTKYYILIPVIKLLKILDQFNGHYIHSVLLWPENALRFYTYPHINTMINNLSISLTGLKY